MNNTKVDDTYDIAVVVPVHNLIEYSDTCLKTSRVLQELYRDERASDNNKVIIDFPAGNNNSISFK